MIKVQFYRCEYCGDTFEVEGECKACEASHINTQDIKIEKCKYKYGEPYPSSILIDFDDGKQIEYIRVRKQLTEPDVYL